MNINRDNKILQLNLQKSLLTKQASNRANSRNKDVESTGNSKKRNNANHKDKIVYYDSSKGFWDSFDKLMIVSQLIRHNTEDKTIYLSPVEIFLLLQIKKHNQFTDKDIKKLAQKFYYSQSVLAFHIHVLTKKKLLSCIDRNNRVHYATNDKSDTTLQNIEIKSTGLHKLLHKLNPCLDKILSILS